MKKMGPFNKIIIIIVFLAIYIPLLVSGYRAIEACSNTPSKDNTLGYILTLLLPIILGFMVYKFYLIKKNFAMRSYLYVVLFTIGVLILSVFFTVMEELLIINFLREAVSNKGVFDFIFEYGCYHDIEIKGIILVFLYIINVLLLGIITYKFVPHKK